MKKFFKLTVFLALFGLIVLCFNQEAYADVNEITTIEQLKNEFGGKATIDGNVLTLTDDVSIQDDALLIAIRNLTIDINGNILEIR